MTSGTTASGALANAKRSVVLYGASMAIPGIASLASAPILTRVLTQESYATYVLALSLIGAASALNSWLGMSVLRFFPVAEADGRPRQFFSATLRVGLVASALMGVVGGVASLAVNSGPGPALGLVVVCVCAFVVGDVANVLLSFARIRERVGAYVGYTAWKALGSLALGTALVGIVQEGTIGMMLGLFVTVLVALPFLWKSAAVPRETAQKSRPGLSIRTSTMQMARYGIPLTVSEIAAWGLRVSDRWLLQAFVGTSSVAVYSATYTLAESGILVVIAIFQLALRPIEVRLLHAADGDERLVFASQSTRLFLLLALPVASFGSVFAFDIFRLAVPQEYLHGASLAPWVIWSGVFLGLQQRFQIGVIVGGRTTVISIGALIGLSVNLSLNVLLLPHFGMKAAAWSTFAGYFVFFVFVAAISRRYMRWAFPFRAAGVVLVCSGIAGLVSALVSRSVDDALLRVLIAACVFGITYAVGLSALREVDLRRLLSPIWHAAKGSGTR